MNCADVCFQFRAKTVYVKVVNSINSLWSSMGKCFCWYL